MMRRLVAIVILMSSCTIGIVGLQLFWNYQNYLTTARNFSHDVNEALKEAVSREVDARRQFIVSRFRSWMTDSSFVVITCSYNRNNHQTVFHVRDRHPLKDSSGLSLGISTFKDSLNAITPQAKNQFIDYFVQNILTNDLKKGYIYFYTKRLGDSLSFIYESSRADKEALRHFYDDELASREIDVKYVFSPTNADSSLFLTQAHNTALHEFGRKEMVTAGFRQPGSYFFKAMKWVIISTLLLIVITLFCFVYTTRTLWSQHKLAVLKDNFINNMTHELNTPLAAIRITSEALTRFRHPPETVIAYLNIIAQQTEKLTHLTSQILNVNRRLVIEKEDVDLCKLIQQSLDNLSAQIIATGARINFTSSKLIIKGEKESLLNTFTNVVDNALKYSQERAELVISLQQREGYAQVTFADNGPGIAVEYRTRIFEPFFRVPTGNTHDVKGYGLGLSYIAQVISRHNGNISVGANHPQGSVFTIQLPLP